MNKTDKKKDRPFVFVRCMTFNHEAYIKDALNGFVMQQTNFPFVVSIIDDASTDNNASVITDYLQRVCDFDSIKSTIEEYGKVIDATPADNPNCLLHVVLLNENHYLKKTKRPYYAQYEDAAKYVAMCEGDDYWIDPLKIQKQVDFMESHPEYSLCFTNAKIRFNNFEGLTINHIWDTYTIEDVIINNALNVSKRGDRIITCGHTSTVLYRASCLPLPSWTTKCFVGDEPLFIALAQYGKAKFLNEITSVYRDGVGVSSKDYDEEEYWKNRIKMYKIMNQGMEYRYNAIIKPIIAASYFTLSKLVWKVGKIEKKRDAIVYLCKTLLINPNVIIKWVVTKIKQE